MLNYIFLKMYPFCLKVFKFHVNCTLWSFEFLLCPSYHFLFIPKTVNFFFPYSFHQRFVNIISLFSESNLVLLIFLKDTLEAISSMICRWLMHSVFVYLKYLYVTHYWNIISCNLENIYYVLASSVADKKYAVSSVILSNRWSVLSIKLL